MPDRRIIMLQSADADVYADMLNAGRRVNEAYCRRWNIQYRHFVGIRRGYYPWHACFNRIVMLKDLIDEGFDGCAWYVDADAFIRDSSFDVRRIIAEYDGDMIASPGGDKGGGTSTTASSCSTSAPRPASALPASGMTTSCRRPMTT